MRSVSAMGACGSGRYPLRLLQEELGVLVDVQLARHARRDLDQLHHTPEPTIIICGRVSCVCHVCVVCVSCVLCVL